MPTRSRLHGSRPTRGFTSRLGGTGSRTAFSTAVCSRLCSGPGPIRRRSRAARLETWIWFMRVKQITLPFGHVLLGAQRHVPGSSLRLECVPTSSSGGYVNNWTHSALLPEPSCSTSSCSPTSSAPSGSGSSGHTAEPELRRVADRLRGGPGAPSGARRHVARS